MARDQIGVGSCPVDGLSPRLNHYGEATACRADPPTSIPGLVTGIKVHDHCTGQGLPEPLSETEIGPCNYQREGTTFVDSIENYLSTNINLSPAEPETFQVLWFVGAGVAAEKRRKEKLGSSAGTDARKRGRG